MEFFPTTRNPLQSPPCSLRRCRIRRNGREISYRTRQCKSISKDRRPAPRRWDSPLLIPPTLSRTIRESPVPASIRTLSLPALCKLLERQGAFFFGWRRAVKFGIVLHEGNALALDGFRNNAGRLAFHF